MILRSFATAKISNKLLLKSYMKKTLKQYICLNNEKLAEAVCEKLAVELRDDSKYIFEVSPGNGVLTQKLLEHSACKIRVFENNLEKFNHLKRKFSRNNDRLEISDKQIGDLTTGNYRILQHDREDFVKSIFAGVSDNWSLQSIRKSENRPIEPSILLFAALSPHLAREFLTYLVYAFPRFETFFEKGPTEFYLFVPVSYLKTIVARPSRNLNLYTATTININTLFEYSEIDLSPNINVLNIEKMKKIEGKLFTIISGEYFDYTNNRTMESTDGFVFLKFKPKPFLWETESDFLLNFISFVKQSFMKPSENAIKYYEKHFPECAIDLIGLQISYFKRLGDLTHDEISIIFKHLFLLPQYKNSIFGQQI